VEMEWHNFSPVFLGGENTNVDCVIFSKTKPPVKVNIVGDVHYSN